jgi:hypothetical protein
MFIVWWRLDRIWGPHTPAVTGDLLQESKAAGASRLSLTSTYC